jgi:hypothetical protein
MGEVEDKRYTLIDEPILRKLSMLFSQSLKKHGPARESGVKLGWDVADSIRVAASGMNSGDAPEDAEPQINLAPYFDNKSN